MASPTRWTWVWVNSGSRWWTGRPGVLWFMRWWRVEYDWATELNWTELIFTLSPLLFFHHIQSLFIPLDWAHALKKDCFQIRTSSTRDTIDPWSDSLDPHLISLRLYLSVQFSSFAQSCPTHCDPMNRSTPGRPVHHQLLEFTQT